MKKHNYCDRVLISLRRQYSRDETVAVLNKKIDNLEGEIKQFEFYIQELKEEQHIQSLKNGGLVWFKKYNKLKGRFDKQFKKLK